MLETTKKNVLQKISITTVLLTFVMLFIISGCNEEKLELTQAEKSRENLPALTASNISTIISDSGITRYRITTAEWKIFDKKKEPYWSFPKGIYFERFDEVYKVDAKMKSDKAIFWEKKGLWQFSGNVKATNLKEEQFETEQLFWDERNERIYSEEKIKITQKTKIIYGIGFESNPDLTRYTIRNPKGVIPIDETN